jgi:CHASE2 domain-containing sensor protein
VHLDFNNTSIERLKNLYLNRFHFAQLVRNLKSMQVAAQVYDFIFAAKINEQDDLELIESVKDAGNAYFGLALELRLPNQPGRKKSGPSKGRSYVLRTKWNVAADDNGKLYVGKNPLATYADLANASRGLGALSVKFDPDGVLRRVPLLVPLSAVAAARYLRLSSGASGKNCARTGPTYYPAGRNPAGVARV